jgi:hypothetical protein
MQLSKMKIHLLVAGFVMASIFPAAYIAIIAPLSGERNLISIIGSFFVFYFFSAVVTVIFGLPGFLILQKLQIISWWSTVCYGMLVGSFVHIFVTYSVGYDLSLLLKYAAIGGVSGFIFWIFWHMSRT